MKGLTFFDNSPWRRIASEVMRPRLGALIMIFNLVGSKLRHRAIFGLCRSKNYKELSMSQQAIYEYLELTHK